MSADNHGEVLEFEAVSGVALHLAGRFLGKIRQMGGRFEVVRDPAQGPAEKHHTHTHTQPFSSPSLVSLSPSRPTLNMFTFTTELMCRLRGAKW